MSTKKTRGAWGTLPLLAFLILQCLALPAHAKVGFANIEEDKKAKSALPPKGRALIYIIRSDRPPTEHILPVSVDGKKIGETAGGTFLLATVTPGMHHLASGVKSISLLDINCVAGKTYFVSQKALRGFSPVIIELSVMSPVQGRKLVNQSRLAGNIPVPATGPAAQTAQGNRPRAAPPKSSKFNERSKNVGIILKIGKYKRNDTYAASTDLTTGRLYQFKYDTDASGVVGVEVEYYFAPGLAVGGEYFRFRNSFIATNIINTTSGDHSVDALLVNVKKYFEPTPMLRPFAGVGLGVTTDSLNGDWEGGGISYAYQLVAGTELRWKYVSLYIEYKRLSISSDSKVTVGDVSGSGVLTGLKIAF